MTAGAPSRDSPAVRDGPIPYKWLALITIASANLFATVMMSIVNIGLPSIAQSFGASLATVQWVVVIYPLITASTMLGVGYLGDRLGRKRIFIGGALIFAAGSLLCGLAQSPGQLIAFRIVQGIGGAMCMANSAAIVTNAFPAGERGKSLGMMSTSASLGLSIGPTLGGVLVDTVGWRWIFLISAPMALLTATLATLYLRDRAREQGKAQPFDLAGSFALFVSMASLLLALSEGQQNGWLGSGFIALAALFLASTIGFVWQEQRAPLPTVDLSLLRHRLFAASAIAGLLSYIGFFATMFLMPFYLTRTAGYTASEAGAMLTAVPLAMGTMATLAGWLSDRFGSRWLCTAGMAIATAGLLTIAQFGRTAGFGEVAPALLLIGLGLGLFMVPNNSVVMGCVPAARLGMASAMIATIRHLGSALGVAIAGVVFSVRLTAYSMPGAASTGIFDPAASVGAFRDTYLVLAAFTAAGIFASLVRGPERK